MGESLAETPARRGTRRLRRQLQESNDRYALVAKATNDVIYDINLSNGTIIWNDALQTKYGYPPNEPAGTLEWWTGHVHPDDALRVENEISELIGNDHSTWEIRYRFRRADGDYAVVRDRAYVLRDPEGQPQRIIGSMLDITEADRLDRAKDEFTSLVSHQLRTPLTVIQLYSNMLKDGMMGELQPQQLEQVGRISQASERLIKLVGNILSISRIELGRVDLRPEPTDAGSLIRAAVQEVRPLADDKSVRITVRRSADIPMLMVDQALFREVLQNLLANAVQYSPAGSGKVTISASCGPDGAQIRVSDNGIGIAEKDRPSIFSRFYRADNAVQTGIEGTGLGLYLCRLIVSTMGGDVSFVSTEGKGTTFIIQLPASCLAGAETTGHKLNLHEARGT